MQIKLAGRFVAGDPVTHLSLEAASCRESGETERGKSSDTGMASHGAGGGVLRKAANEKRGCVQGGSSCWNREALIRVSQQAAVVLTQRPCYYTSS